MHFQLFTKCLAENTYGDGTGCDNMTAVIVQFKPALVTKYDNGSTGETISSTKAANKRAASLSESEDVSSEPGKRLKVDLESVEASVAPAEATTT